MFFASVVQHIQKEINQIADEIAIVARSYKCGNEVDTEYYLNKWEQQLRAGA